jgi:hypothetical protein
MKAALRLTLALIAAFGLAGCRTAGLAPSARPKPPAVPEPRLSFNTDRFIADHNRNAEKIESLTSKASISVKMISPESGKPDGGGSVSGYVSMLRPRNFQLVLYGYSKMQSVADIGSNSDQFWFWVDMRNAEKSDKHVFFCNYADLPTANLAGTYQPDWILDALGLKSITPDEAATVRVAPGAKPDTTILTFPASGEPSSYTRVMVVSDVSRRLIEYRVFDRDGKTLIGQATIDDDEKSYSKIELKEEGEDEGRPRTCYIPNQIKLEWKREKLSLDIVLKDISVNRPFTDRMKANFVVPEHRGYTPLDLAEATRGLPRAEGEETAVRETLPAPERGTGVRLGAPMELPRAEADGDLGTQESETPARARPTSRRSDARPAATITPLLTPVFDREVVGAASPRPPGAPQQTAASSFVLDRPTLER